MVGGTFSGLPEVSERRWKRERWGGGGGVGEWVGGMSADYG